MKLCVLVCAALTVAGCGNAPRIPGDAAVTVGDDVITRSEFDHWRNVVSIWAQQGVRDSGGDAGGANCTSDDHEADEALADGTRVPWCGREAEDVRTDALRVLISLRWLEGEARAMGLEITDAEVQAALDEHKLQAFAEEDDYRAFLRETGTTEADMLISARLAVLTKRVDEAALDRGIQISEDEVERFYQSRRGRFSRPEERDLLVVVTRSEAQAREALAALRAGKPWAEVAAEQSRDPSAVDGGRIEARPRGLMPAAVDEAVFNARADVLSGPVSAPDGYYVFKVTKITPAGEQSPDAARETIRQLLRSQRQNDVLKRFKSEFTERWRARTKCEPDFVVAECGNAAAD